MAKSETAAQDTIPTREGVVEALRQVLADIEAGKLRGGGWREQDVVSAIGFSHQVALPRPPPTRRRPDQRRGFQHVRRAQRISCVAWTSLPGASDGSLGLLHQVGRRGARSSPPCPCLDRGLHPCRDRRVSHRRATASLRHRARTTRQLHSDRHAEGTRALIA
jgi:hypothetical protein